MTRQGTFPQRCGPRGFEDGARNSSPGDFVKIEGMVERFRERNQLVIEKMRVVARAEVPGIDELVRTSPYDPDALLDEIKIRAQGLKPQELAELVTEILENNGETLKAYPTARMVHHAYTGGLIEHVATVTRKVEVICSMEPAVNKDIAVAGAMLHDIGKLRELDPPKRGRTLEGRLVGHLVLGVEMILEAALHKNVIDRTWLKELEHIVVSHHGETDFGSPVRPLTREAMVVHYIDNLDAKLKIIEEALQSPEPDGFSSYNRWLEGRAFAGSQSLEKEEDDAGT